MRRKTSMDCDDRLILAVLARLAAPPAEEPDADDKAEALVRIERVVRENCLMCHSAAMIESATPHAGRSGRPRSRRWSAGVRLAA